MVPRYWPWWKKALPKSLNNFYEKAIYNAENNLVLFADGIAFDEHLSIDANWKFHPGDDWPVQALAHLPQNSTTPPGEP